MFDRAMSREPVQLDDCKLSVLLTFHRTQIWRLGNLAFGEASNDYTALGI